METGIHKNTFSNVFLCFTSDYGKDKRVRLVVQLLRKTMHHAQCPKHDTRVEWMNNIVFKYSFYIHLRTMILTLVVRVLLTEGCGVVYGFVNRGSLAIL